MLGGGCAVGRSAAWGDWDWWRWPTAGLSAMVGTCDATVAAEAQNKRSRRLCRMAPGSMNEAVVRPAPVKLTQLWLPLPADRHQTR